MNKDASPGSTQGSKKREPLRCFLRLRFGDDDIDCYCCDGDKTVQGRHKHLTSLLSRPCQEDQQSKVPMPTILSLAIKKTENLSTIGNTIVCHWVYMLAVLMIWCCGPEDEMISWSIYACNNKSMHVYTHITGLRREVDGIETGNHSTT